MQAWWYGWRSAVTMCVFRRHMCVFRRHMCVLSPCMCLVAMCVSGRHVYLDKTRLAIQTPDATLCNHMAALY